MEQKKAAWFVYVLECVGGRLYTGIAVDVEKRFAAHLAGKGARFTRSNKPMRILGSMKCGGRSEASKLEWAVKRMTQAEKRETAGGWAAAQ